METTVIAVLIVACAMLGAMLAVKNRTEKKHRDEIAASRQELAEAYSSVEVTNEKINMLGSLYKASDTLIHLGTEQEVYETVIEHINSIVSPKIILFYSYESESRCLLLRSCTPKNVNYPKDVNVSQTLFRPVKTQDEFSFMLVGADERKNPGNASSKEKILGYIKIIGKREKVANYLKEISFTESDYTILTIYLNQVAMILDKIKTYNTIRKMALTDNLTGLYTRHYAHMRIEQEISKADEKKYPLSVLFVDIDKFKNVNDTYGHDVGDLALQHVAAIIRENIRDADIPVRWGGEEFLLFLPATETEGALKMGERLRSKIEDGKFHYCKLTVSLGISTYPEDSNNIMAVIDNADHALYYSKETGRNRCTSFNNIKHMMRE